VLISAFRENEKTVFVSTLLVAPDLQHGSINGGKNI
jgi:hypothetical protein